MAALLEALRQETAQWVTQTVVAMVEEALTRGLRLLLLLPLLHRLLQVQLWLYVLQSPPSPVLPQALQKEQVAAHPKWSSCPLDLPHHLEHFSLSSQHAIVQPTPQKRVGQTRLLAGPMVLFSPNACMLRKA